MRAEMTKGGMVRLAAQSLASERRAGKYDMGVCPAETKRVDACVPPLTRRVDQLGMTHQSEVQVIECDVGVRRLAMQCRGHDTPVEGERRF